MAPTDRRRPRAGLVRLAQVVALVVVAAAVVALVSFGALAVVTRDEDSSAPAPPAAPDAPDAPDAPGGVIEASAEPAATRALERGLVTAGATAFVQAVTTYGPDDLARDGTMPVFRRTVLSLVTPAYGRDFRVAAAAVETATARARTGRVGRVRTAGVQSLTRDRATVLIGGVLTIEGGDPATLPFRSVVTLARAADRWLVDSFDSEGLRGGGLVVDGVEEGALAAASAAIDGITDVLAYDQRTLDASLARARARMTPSYADDYAALTGPVRGAATGTVVTVRPRAAGVAFYDGVRAEVVLYVDRTVVSAARPTPTVLRETVTVTMALDDGRWLVDGLDPAPDRP